MRRLCTLLLTMAIIATLAVPFGLVYSGQHEPQALAITRLEVNEVMFTSDNSSLFWVEIYNPTGIVIDLSGLRAVVSHIVCFIRGPLEPIRPHQYILLCNNATAATREWGLQGVPVYEFESWGLRKNADLEIEQFRGYDVESVTADAFPPDGDDLRFYSIDEGHSWARYRGSPEGSYLLSEYYDEPDPTPGAPNPRWMPA